MKSDEYFAGLFDGEGSVSMSLRKDGYIGITVAIVMCDRAPVLACFERFGGSFEDGKYKTKTGRSVFRWVVSNADAAEALEVLSSLCLVKYLVAQAALPCAQSMAANKTRQPLSAAEKRARLLAAETIARINKPVGKRRVLDAAATEAYLKEKTVGGGKAIRLSDGREFPSINAAARALNVTHAAVGHAKRKGRLVKGLRVESI